MPVPHSWMNPFKAMNEQHGHRNISVIKNPVLIKMGLKCLSVDRFHLNCKNSELVLCKCSEQTRCCY